MIDSTIPYIKNQMYMNHINLGQTIFNILWIFVAMAIVSAIVAFIIAFLYRQHETIDGQVQEILTDRWGWIPLVSMFVWVCAAMAVIFKFMNM